MKRKVLRVAVVITVALGAGHIVQNMQKNQLQRSAAHAPRAMIGGIEHVAADDRDEETTRQPATNGADGGADDGEGDQSTLTPAAPLPSGISSSATSLPELAENGSCEPVMTVHAREHAQLDVAISAPCSAGNSITLNHAGLTFAARLDAAGRLALEIPAFHATGHIEALTADGHFVSVGAPVNDLATIRRVAVQWVGEDALQLHAFENGANYDEAGDVNAGNPVSPSGGVLTRLGDPELALPMMAEIYTWPADAEVHAETAVEAAVTDATCNRSITGELLQLDSDQVVIDSLSFDMPGCDAIGDIMVLNIPAPERTLASVD